MEGIKGYSKPAPDGKGVRVDTEAMLVDLITVCKAGGVTREQWIDWCSITFDAVDVRITIPQSAKN